MPFRLNHQGMAEESRNQISGGGHMHRKWQKRSVSDLLSYCRSHHFNLYVNIVLALWTLSFYCFRKAREKLNCVCVEEGFGDLESVANSTALSAWQVKSVSEVSQVKDNRERSVLGLTGEHVANLKWAAAIHLP